MSTRMARKRETGLTISEFDFIRMHLPWSTAPLLSGSYEGEDEDAWMRWMALMLHVRDEIEALCPDDRLEAFARALQVLRFLDQKPLTCGWRRSASEWDLRLRAQVSAILQATLGGGPNSLAKRLCVALMRREVNMALVLDDERVARMDQEDLLDRLTAISSDGRTSRRSTAVVTWHQLLGSNDSLFGRHLLGPEESILG